MKRPTHPTRPYVLPLAAAALVGAMLPVATASSAGAAAEEDKRPLSYSTEVSGTPIEIEIYEPTIPIPTTPQLELLFGYTKVEATTDTGAGLASYLWPGDSIGQGLKTVVENLGLPPEISGPIAAQGYPFQVNSNYPSGEESATDEPFPGTIQRTGASPEETFAEIGFSSDCTSQAPDGGGGGGGAGGGGGGGLPGVPGLPELPIPLLGGLTGGLTSALTGGVTGSAAAPTDAEGAAAEEAQCQIPAALAAVVDIGGYSSVSRNSSDDVTARSTNRAAASDISLLGGVVQISSVRANAVTTSDGTKKGSTATGQADIGILTVAGQKFRLGPDGFEAAGQGAGFPALPEQAAAALEQLGITITLPKPTKVVSGDEVSSSVVGLSVELDLKTLNMVLTQLPLSDIFIELPDDLGPLKSALLSAANLASRVVVNLAVADATIKTSDPIAPPVIPEPEPEEESGEGEGDGASGGNTSGGATGSSAGVPPSSTPAAPGGDVAPAAGELPADAALASGLPKLFSIPGVLLFGGLALATVLGSYMRKMGALALGGGAACPHGLDSGLPDLRKA